MKELSEKKVVVIAGPSASGKSYLIRQLMCQGKNHFRDKVCHQLDINAQEPRSRISIGALTKLDSKPGHSRKLSKDLIFIHFDITSRNQSEKRKMLGSIAGSCKEIKFATLKTAFDVWHERMQQRIERSTTKNPSNNADNIYKLSQLSWHLAKWRYESTYRQWEKFIKDIHSERQIIIKNEDMPLKIKKPNS